MCRSKTRVVISRPEIHSVNPKMCRTNNHATMAGARPPGSVYHRKGISECYGRAEMDLCGRKEKEPGSTLVASPSPSLGLLTAARFPPARRVSRNSILVHICTAVSLTTQPVQWSRHLRRPHLTEDFWPYA